MHTNSTRRNEDPRSWTLPATVGTTVGPTVSASVRTTVATTIPSAGPYIDIHFFMSTFYILCLHIYIRIAVCRKINIFTFTESTYICTNICKMIYIFTFKYQSVIKLLYSEPTKKKIEGVHVILCPEHILLFHWGLSAVKTSTESTYICTNVCKMIYVQYIYLCSKYMCVKMI